MDWIAWTAVALAGWCLVSVAVGLLLGSLLRRRRLAFSTRRTLLVVVRRRERRLRDVA